MPCHNGEKFISDSIQSVINQSYKDWELLVINDNSTDNSASIIKMFSKKDSRIKFFDCEISTGMPATPRNLGIKNASGDLMAFLDSDDIWLENKLENQINLIKQTNCDVVYSNYKKIDENSNIISEVIKAPQKVNFKRLLNGNCIANLTGMYNCSKIGKILQKETHHEDYLMWLEILKHTDFAYNTNSIDGYYRILNKSVSSNKIDSLK